MNTKSRVNYLGAPFSPTPKLIFIAPYKFIKGSTVVHIIMTFDLVFAARININRNSEKLSSPLILTYHFKFSPMCEIYMLFFAEGAFIF